jgi:DNA N-6-adenine-methyltransferase (Dam)
LTGRCTVCAASLSPQATGRPRATCSPACKQAAYRRRHRKLKTTLEILGSSRSPEWPTDPAFLAKLEARFGPFSLDPCCTPETAKCDRYFTRADDGLAQTWTGRVLMNPPAREIDRRMRKAYESAQTMAEILVCLVPVRTDTQWWHSAPAPFPSAVAVFRNAKAVTELRLVEDAA